MYNNKLIDRIMWYHRRSWDGESNCIEVENAHTTILSDQHCITEDGREYVIPKEEAQREREKEKCHFCEYLRKLKAKM